MTDAPIADNEALRQFELNQYLITDTSCEREFDELAELAAMICEVPMAVVSLIDGGRQWNKAQVGFGLQELPRNESISAHAMYSENDLFVVPDTQADHRFKDFPLVTGSSQVRFYAGAPLVNINNYPLGTLCIMDTKPRTLTPEQQKAVIALGRLTTSLIEQRRDRLEMIESISDCATAEDFLEKEQEAQREEARQVAALSPGLLIGAMLAGTLIGYTFGSFRKHK